MEVNIQKYTISIKNITAKPITPTLLFEQHNHSKVLNFRFNNIDYLFERGKNIIFTLAEIKPFTKVTYNYLLVHYTISIKISCRNCISYKKLEPNFFISTLKLTKRQIRINSIKRLDTDVFFHFISKADGLLGIDEKEYILVPNEELVLLKHKNNKSLTVNYTWNNTSSLKVIVKQQYSNNLFATILQKQKKYSNDMLNLKLQKDIYCNILKIDNIHYVKVSTIKLTNIGFSTASIYFNNKPYLDIDSYEVKEIIGFDTIINNKISIPLVVYHSTVLCQMYHGNKLIGQITLSPDRIWIK